MKERENYNFSIFKVPLGYLGLVLSDLGLQRVILPISTFKKVKEILNNSYTVAVTRDEEKFKELKRQFKAYFAGRNPKFKVKLDLSGYTPFELKVFEQVIQIPYGEVRSYSYIAKKLGNEPAKRAVGLALSRNRHPLVIPCHRVVAKHRGLGGFAGGIQTKVKLLRLEGRLL